MKREYVELINVESELVDKLQALFEDYRAKQDLLTMIFELHKYDNDSAIIDSVPFRNYERRFGESKIAYETMIDLIRNNYIPSKYDSSEYNFEVDFELKKIKIYKA